MASGRVLITATHEGVITSIVLTVSLGDDADGDGLPDDFESANAVDPGGSNLARLPGVGASSSSFLAGFPPGRTIDGNLQTSWFTAENDAANRGTSPFLQVNLPTDVGIAQVRLFGNRQFPNGRDVFAGVVQAFDATGSEIFNSGEVRLTDLDRDLGLALDLDGVRSVRFTSTSDEGSTPGLSEIQLISRPGGPGLDPNDPADAAADFDGDGLANLDEFNQGTSPFLADTDGDRLSDAQEIAIGSSPVNPDSDFDGLLDGDETNPTADPDGDGLANVLDPDSDNDGLPDAVEFAIAGNTTGANPNVDSDGDGLLNIDEVEEDTDPTNPDTDGDGLNDLQEALGPTDALDPDSDDDGFLDGFEVELGSDPLDPESLPRVSSSGTIASATFSILNLVDPGGPEGTEPVGEAVSPTISVLNVIDPGDPAGTDPITEAVSPTLSLLNLIEPAGPAGSDPIGAAVSPTLSILNQVEPSGSLGEAVSALFSIFAGSDAADFDGDGLSDGEEAALGEDPRVADAVPPRVAVTAPAPDSTLFEGQTLTVRADARDNGRVTAVDFLVDGVVFHTVDARPYEMTWTVPAGLGDVTFSATARDTAGNAATSADVSAPIAPDPLTTVKGQVLDAAGEPVAGAKVEIYLQGFEAELFDFEKPLESLPDLDGLVPAATLPVSAINFRNPGGLLRGAMLGEDLAPDFAARFSGLLEVPEPGGYQLTLGAAGGARLTIAGEQIVVIPASEGFVEASGRIDLAERTVAMVVDYYQQTGNAELQLSYAPPGERRRVIPTSALFQPRPLLTATTAADGTFSVEGVPTILGEVMVSATAEAPSGKSLSGWTVPVELVPGGITECGPMKVSTKPATEIVSKLR